MSRKWFVAALAAVVLTVAVTGASLAQTATPGTQAAPSTTGPSTAAPAPGLGFRGGDLFGVSGKQDWTEFDTLAQGLKLTPTQLFEALHSGKSVSDIATEQGVDLTALQAQAQEARKQARIDEINAAVAAGTMTQEQADWLLQGIENGWNGGPAGRAGPGMGGHGGRGHGMGMMPGQAPAAQPQATPNA